MSRAFVLAVLLAAAPAAWGECIDPAAPADDCDEDGFSPGDGDCDDEDPDVHEGAQDVCDDGIDNNCNGTVDDDCDLRDGAISGGSGCGAEGGWAGLFLPLPLLLMRRRRS